MSAWIIRGGRVLDAREGRAEPADVLVDGGTIKEIGRPGLAAPEGAQLLDAADRLLVPGLLNSHTHGHGTLGRGAGDRFTLELLLNAGPWTGGNYTLEDKALAAKLGAVEMVRRGCVAAYDLFAEFPSPTVEGLVAVGGAYAEVGMRAVVAPMMADRTFWRAIPGLFGALPADLQAAVDRIVLAPYETSLNVCREILKSWPYDGTRQRLALAPTIPHHCADEFLVACRDLAREAGVGLHTHVAESRMQAVVGVKKYGHTLTAHLDSLGVVGPNFTAAHAVWLDPDDMRRMADRGASVAHNPSSNLRLGSGVAAVRAFREHGVNVGLGTDAATCSDHLNMFEVMRLASGLSRVSRMDPNDWLGAREVFELATLGSARALGLGHGEPRLVAGGPADIVLLDLSDPAWIPFNDPLRQLVFAESGAGVDSVMIDGRLVVHQRRVLTVDTAALRRQAEAAVERLRRVNAPARAVSEAAEKVVGAFCLGLSREPYPVDRFVGGAVLR
ncbi:MAG TPA: amidohydrolase family protein [Methylomirabilota bacterium]|nr:amidohydrolase family protein [Methylomirabilota bacterium]